MPLIRLNFSAYESGEEYINRLKDETDKAFKVLLALLSSYWQSTIDGPNYARELKAVAIALARIRLSLDDVRADTDYRSTRAEYVYQTLTSMLFPKRYGAPDPGFGDREFVEFLRNVVEVYFAGSIPESMKRATELVTHGMEVVVHENFLESRDPTSSLDISDEFGFRIDVMLPSPSSIDVMLADKNVRILMNVIRPAHTLYRLRFILSDEYVGNKTDNQPHKVMDAFRMALSDYGYEDFRRFVHGMKWIDHLGVKESKSVTAESHTF